MSGAPLAYVPHGAHTCGAYYIHKYIRAFTTETNCEYLWHIGELGAEMITGKNSPLSPTTTQI